MNDCIAPYGNARQVLSDLTRNVFPDQIATSIDRTPDGGIRKINRWTGYDYRMERIKKNAQKRVAQ